MRVTTFLSYVSLASESSEPSGSLGDPELRGYPPCDDNQQIMKPI